MPKRGELILVCPNSETLLSRLRGKPVVVRVSSEREIQGAHDRASGENHLHCVVLELKAALSEVPLSEERKSIPLSLHVQEMGDLKRVMRRLKLLRESNIRVFMPAGRSENLTSVRILSSLGVATGLVLASPLDWDAVNDLMHYAMYTRILHADIEPFGYVTSAYEPRDFTYLGTPLFENPLKYVHVDEGENLALSADGLREGKWIAQGLACLPELTASPEYRASIHSWQGMFLEDRKCAYCPAWRLCQGAYLADCDRDGNVLHFFEDFLAAADASYTARQEGAKWQP